MCIRTWRAWGLWLLEYLEWTHERWYNCRGGGLVFASHERRWSTFNVALYSWQCRALTVLLEWTYETAIYETHENFGNMNCQPNDSLLVCPVTPQAPSEHCLHIRCGSVTNGSPRWLIELPSMTFAGDSNASGGCIGADGGRWASMTARRLGPYSWRNFRFHWISLARLSISVILPAYAQSTRCWIWVYGKKKLGPYMS